MVTRKEDLSGQTIVIKIGGSTLGEGDSTIPDVIELRNRGARPVVVHGGGKVISQWVALQGIQPTFVRGLRKTDRATLDVAVAVLAGLVNAELVAEFDAQGAKAVGLSGVSGGMLRANIMDEELGYVGNVVETNVDSITTLLNAGIIPVIAPIALAARPSDDEPSDSDVRMLNINADTSAGHIAKALEADRLVFQTDIEGVMDATRRLIPRMTKRQARDLILGGIAAGGMIPKIDACIEALETVGSGHIIDGRVAGALLECCEGGDVGTRII